MNKRFPEWSNYMAWVKTAIESRYGSITNAKMAKYLHTNTSTVAAWMCGQNKIELPEILLISYIFEIDWQILCKKGYSLTKDEAWLEAMDWEAPV